MRGSRRKPGRIAVSVGITVLGVLVPLGTANAAPSPGPPVPPPVAPVAPAAPPHRVLGALLASRTLGAGVTERDFTTTGVAGPVVGHEIEADLTDPRVNTDLLTPGAVAAVAPVPQMADRGGAVAAINGDFFDFGGSGAPAGPAIAGLLPLKAAVPAGRRAAPPAPPGTGIKSVFGVSVDRRAHVGRLRLVAAAAGPSGVLPVVGLNQYAIPVGGIGLFTPVWGTASRAAATCGTDAGPGPCRSATREVVVRNGVVAAVNQRPGTGPISPDEVILVGRDGGAGALGTLRVGDPVLITYQLLPDLPDASPYRFAVGGIPVLRDGVAYAGLDTGERAPRSAAGTSPDGRRLYLVAVDGREESSVGVTLAEFAELLRELGVDDAVNLDGGGSATLVYRPPGQPRVIVVNDPSVRTPRPVPNAIGVFTTP